MKEYEKVIDYKTNEAKYCEIIDGIMVIVSKDIIIDEYKNEIERLNNIINEVANDILKELNENKHLSYGVALNIRQKLLNYQELKEGEKNVEN